MENNTRNISRFLIYINLSEILTPSEHLAISKVLFCRTNPAEIPSIRSCLYHLAIGTQIKVKTDSSFNEIKEILVSWKVDTNQNTLPRFQSPLLSCVEEHKDSEFKKWQRKIGFHLIGTNTIRILSVPESKYLEHQLLEYVEKFKKLGRVEQFISK